MKRRLSAKQIAAGFGGKRRKAARKARRAPRSKPRRLVRRKAHRMPKHKSRSRSRKTINVAKTAAAIAGLGILTRPYVVGHTADSIRSSSWASLPGNFASDSREALSFGNVVKAAAPAVVVGLTSWGLRSLRIPAPRVGPLKAF